MAVIHANIKSALMSLYSSAHESELTDEQFADAMATIIRNAILSADVQSGIAVQVVPATGIGATTETGTLL